MRLLKLLIPVVAFAACLLPTTTAGAAEPGVNAASTDPGTIAQALDTGAKTVRLFVSWAEMEPSKGAYPAGSGVSPAYDAAIHQINARGAKPLFVVLNTPSWANGSNDQLVPPNDPNDYASFMKQFVAHNKALGGEVAGYEVWNEPDEALFWHPGADLGRYAALLKATYAAVKQADPSAVVLSGPTTGNNYEWIQGLYNQGAGGSFDVVSVHTDTACLDRGPDAFYREGAGQLARYTFLGYRTVHDVMAANGDGAKPIWMSELGWSSTNGGPTSCARGQWAGQKPSGVSEANQAQFLGQAYRCLANDPYVQKADWFTLKDAGAGGEELNHYGLLGTNGAPKPAYDAFKAVAAANGGGGGSCGDFDGPSIRVVKPTPGQQFVDKLDLSAAATDSGVGLARITFSYDNQPAEIRNFTDALQNNVPVGLAPWQNSGKLAFGPHTITVTALDKNGNTSTVNVQVTKVPLSALKSTLTPTIKYKTKKVKCTKKRVCRISGSMSRAAAAAKAKGAVPSLGGKVAIEWQFRNKKGKWRKLVGGLKPANKAFTFSAKLKYKGKWRVRVLYKGQAPWKKVNGKYLTFKVK